MNRRDELIRAEDERHAEIATLLEGLSPEQFEEPGYAGKWSIKDVVAHLACWCAEGAQYLQQMRMGTYRLSHEDIEAIDRDIDEINRRFYETCRNLSVNDVKVEWSAARQRILQEWWALPEMNRDAEYWFRDCGPKHYEEHLPRLREWVAELRGEQG